METIDNPVVIFDVVCNFCNASVNLIMDNDTSGKIRFTANQDSAWKSMLTQFKVDVKEVSTVFFLENGKLFQRSTAALRIAKYMRFPWFLFYAFIIIPPFLRDPVYNFIARNRYNWFGKRDACRIPSLAEKSKFL